MGKWKSGDWLVHYSHFTSDAGYQWEPPSPVHRISYMGDESTEILKTRSDGGVSKRVIRKVIDRPDGEVSSRDRLGVSWQPGRQDHEQATHWPTGSRTSWGGSQKALSAIREFRKLARAGIAFRTWRVSLENSDIDPYERQQEFVLDRRAQVLEYANKFGMLWGDGDPRSLDDWEQECADFLAADTLATWITLAKRGQGRSRYSKEGKLAGQAVQSYKATVRDIHEVERGNPGSKGVAYPAYVAEHNYIWIDLTSYGGKVVRVENPGLRVLDRNSGEVVSTVNIDTIRAQPAIEQMWTVFKQIVSPKLKGGLSLALGDSPTSDADIGIVNSELVHMLYLRLWLDVIEARPIPRRCMECGDEFEEGTRSRKYCSDACKQRSYRRRNTA